MQYERHESRNAMCCGRCAGGTGLCTNATVRLDRHCPRFARRLWHDFKFFLGESCKAEDAGDAALRYRYLRAALFSLFAHVNAIFDLLIDSRKSDTDFQDFRRAELPPLKGASGFPRCEHGEFMVLLNRFFAVRQNLQLPKVNFEVKLLRNVLAHPTGRKTDVSAPFTSPWMARVLL